MNDVAATLEKADQNLPQSLERLFDLIRLKSISTDPAYAGECRAAAQWLVAQLAQLGFSASVRDTAGHPMVVAHHEAPAGAPHVLFYGHYDVQPIDPLSLWSSDPF
jgi:acetylornithine deacetylase/succinyl-diaminopimelate desuccinylase-like protein